MKAVDERFLMHRLRSTSTAGVTGGVLASLLWYYHFLVDHRFDWNLFAIAVTMAAIKVSLMAWYHFTD